MTAPIHIAAAGARTPVGMRAAPSAAAVRAGITALKHHPFMVDCAGDLIPAAVDSELDPRTIGPGRLLAMAEAALREACAPLGDTPARLPRLPVYLGLPELRPGFTQRDAEAVRDGVARLGGLPVGLSEVNIFTQGHAAGFIALARAVGSMRLGAFEACLVGGVDSYFHPDTIEWLDANRQLVGTVSRSGFVPGEGAGFCLLASEGACVRLGLKAQVRLLTCAVGNETKLIKTSEMCFGEGLTATVREAVSALRLPAERINQVICDINGERYRGEEWGFVCLRMSRYFDDPAAYLSPADCWGDTGAASGPLFAMLVCQAVARGYSKGPRTMVWASSEAGQRGGAVLEAVGLA
jgi:3-oxoacyl-[acyl-carrier-protein] synthase-1